MVALPSSFARTLLDLAAEVERDERLIKLAILDAARQGNSGMVARIVDLWLTRPPSEVLAQTSKKSGEPI